MNKVRILIVDDEPINLENLREDLEDAGYEVVEAQDGIQALKILKQDSGFKVILLDKMMPNMGGEEVLLSLKSDSKLSKIPIIMQTAINDVKEVYKSYDEGCYFYLEKPFTKNILLEVVKKAVFLRR